MIYSFALAMFPSCLALKANVLSRVIAGSESVDTDVGACAK